MSVYYTLCFLAALAILIAFANQYVVKIQTTIAITAGSMLISALMVLFGKLGWFNLEPLAIETMKSIDFQNFLLKGILGFLLFAGGIGINLKAFKTSEGFISLKAGISLVGLDAKGLPCTPEQIISHAEKLLPESHSSGRVTALRLPLP